MFDFSLYTCCRKVYFLTIVYVHNFENIYYAQLLAITWFTLKRFLNGNFDAASFNFMNIFFNCEYIGKISKVFEQKFAENRL